MIQFLTWVADRPRTYLQTMEAWRSTCPRLSVWEDAIINGLVRLDNGTDRAVELTRRGRTILKKAEVLSRTETSKKMRVDTRTKAQSRGTECSEKIAGAALSASSLPVAPSSPPRRRVPKSMKSVSVSSSA
jgi:hypothetical protein